MMSLDANIHVVVRDSYLIAHALFLGQIEQNGFAHRRPANVPCIKTKRIRL